VKTLETVAITACVLVITFVVSAVVVGIWLNLMLLWAGL
jgi:hypothetical protein